MATLCWLFTDLHNVAKDPETIHSGSFLLMVNGGKAAFGDDLVDEGLKRGRGWCDLEGLAEHGFGFVEERFVFAEEGDEGLVGFDFVT